MIPSFGFARLPSSPLGSPFGTSRFEEAPGEFTEALLPLRFQSCHCASSFSLSLSLSLYLSIYPSHSHSHSHSRSRSFSLPVFARAVFSLDSRSAFRASSRPTRLHDDVRQRSPVIEGFFEDQHREAIPHPCDHHVRSRLFVQFSSNEQRETIERLKCSNSVDILEQSALSLRHVSILTCDIATNIRIALPLFSFFFANVRTIRSSSPLERVH